MKKEIFILKNHNEEQKDIEIQANLEIENKILSLEFNIIGDIENYLFDKPSIQKRENELWKRTCFELFIAPKSKSNYNELNISPSSEWNFYHFSNYKIGMKEDKDISKPSIYSSIRKNHYLLSCKFTINNKILEDKLIFNLAVILLDKKGLRHFYSINRKRGVVDFHNREYWVYSL